MTLVEAIQKASLTNAHRELGMGRAEFEDAIVAALRIDYRDALLFLVELKRVKRRMEAGIANDVEQKFYEDNKEVAWLNAEAALAA